MSSFWLRSAPLPLLFAIACGSPAADPDAGTFEDVGATPDAGAMQPDDSPYKGPWVMRPSTTAVVVRWESRLRPAMVQVDYHPEAGGTTLTADGTSTQTTVLLEYGITAPTLEQPDRPGTYYVNEVEVTGLTPATCYLYSIAGYPDEHGRFCTMHLPTDTTTPITFYAIGDTSPAIMHTLALMARSDPATTEFTVHVGDLQYYSTIVESQQLWFSLMQPMLRANAFMPCVGNHESERDHEFDDIYARLFANPGRDGNTLWFHYETGGVHFFSLSTEHDVSMGSEQLTWFEDTLDRVEMTPGYRFSIVYFHRPIYTLGSYMVSLSNRAAIEPILAAHRVPLVLAGHLHGYERFQIGDITHVTTGAGGFADRIETLTQHDADFPADAARRVTYGSFYEAMIVTITRAGADDVISARVLDDMGMPRDTFDIHVTPGPR